MNTRSTLHVIGAGLAGLSAALALAEAGHRVIVSESSPQAGGRCRAWDDATLGRRIDNGTHLVVGGNRAVFDWLKAIGSKDGLTAAPTALPILDLATGVRWQATPAALWRDMLATLWHLAWPGDATVGETLSGLRDYQRFWQPLVLAILNLPAEHASARLFRTVLAKTLWRGTAASQGYLARHDLAASFVTPALDRLAALGVEVRYGRRLRGLERSVEGRVEALAYDGERVALAEADRVILAVPWFIAETLLPSLPPLTGSAIVNAHFRLSHPAPVDMLGIVNGHCQWIFGRGDVVSVTLSGADAYIDRDGDEIAGLLWPEIARALDLKEPPIATRVIKEKRATLLHTPAMEALRPHPKISANLVLAGDWTATGLPCTLEGALVSGRRAAQLTQESLR